MQSHLFSLLLLLQSLKFSSALESTGDHESKLLSKFLKQDDGGTKWALLITGERGWSNYRFQADVCHAHQVMKAGGLKDENIIVFMWDDIANNTQNPYKGQVFNKPNGPDVYKGVPRDYTGDNVNRTNFFGVLKGDKSALVGDNSGKVLNSGPNDHVFIHYTGHGGSGMLGLGKGLIYGYELVDALKWKYNNNQFKSLVIYVNACESGEIFQGLLPENMNIYAVSATNRSEFSWATYCPFETFSVFNTCLGDLFSVAWLEDTEASDRQVETLSGQYKNVRDRIRPKQKL